MGATNPLPPVVLGSHYNGGGTHHATSHSDRGVVSVLASPHEWDVLLRDSLVRPNARSICPMCPASCSAILNA
jgi:hypothetical protein